VRVRVTVLGLGSELRVASRSESSRRSTLLATTTTGRLWIEASGR